MLEEQLFISVDRDSVCAGDDCVSHSAVISIAGACPVSNLLEHAWNACPLASISGNEATWLIDIGGDAQFCIGVMAQQWRQPRLTIACDTTTAALFQNQAPYLYFRYWCQVDPELVFDSLQSGRPLPKRYA